MHHFENLVGVSEAKVPEECKEEMAWKITEDWLTDWSRYEKEWEVETDPMGRNAEGRFDGEELESSESIRNSIRGVEEFRIFTKGAMEADEGDVGPDERGEGGRSNARRLD